MALYNLLNEWSDDDTMQGLITKARTIRVAYHALMVSRPKIAALTSSHDSQRWMLDIPINLSYLPFYLPFRKPGLFAPLPGSQAKEFI